MSSSKKNKGADMDDSVNGGGKGTFKIAPLRPLEDFLTGRARFQIPDLNNSEQWLNRVIQNLLYYQTNYFLAAIIILALILWPILLPVVAFTLIHASLRMRNLGNKVDNVKERLGLSDKTPMAVFLEEVGIKARSTGRDKGADMDDSVNGGGKGTIKIAPLRPLKDFLTGRARFQIPDFNSGDRWLNRVTQNLLYYQTNYFVAAIVIFTLFPPILLAVVAFVLIHASLRMRDLDNKVDNVKERLGLSDKTPMAVFLEVVGVKER